MGDSTTPLWTPTSTNLFNAQNGPMANLGVQARRHLSGLRGRRWKHRRRSRRNSPTIEFQNGEVGIQLKMLAATSASTSASSPTSGCTSRPSSAYYALVDGYVPVNELPTIAELSQTQSGQANLNPISYQEYQGEADNEAETSTFADVAQTQLQRRRRRASPSA